MREKVKTENTEMREIKSEMIIEKGEREREREREQWMIL